MADNMETDENARAPSQGRLVIEKMVLHNFKSYAGTKTVGPFHKNFTSVVGPNGSGKSNVIDAMLFVFGFKTAKLRLSKVSELIHNSTNHKDLDSASVMVHFVRIIDLDDDTSEKVAGSEFVVGRVAHRNNTSDYLIDGRKQTAKVVVERLKQEGIDLNHNRFLILQGEVEQISLMDAQQLLSYLSEIIGTHEYEELLAEQAKKLEELTEVRQSAMNRAKAADKKVAATAGPAAITQAYNAKRAELAGAEDTKLQLYIRTGEKSVAKLNGHVEEVKAAIEHEADKLKAFEADQTALKGSAKEAEAAVTKSQRALDGATKRFNDFERADAKRTEESKAAKAKAKKLRTKRDKDAAALQKCEDDVERLPGEIEAHQARVAQLTEELAGAEAGIERLAEAARPEREALTRKQQDISQKLQPHQRAVAEAKARQSEPAAERDMLSQKHAVALKAFQDAEAGAAEAAEAADTCMAEAKSLNAEKAKNQAAAEAAQQQETNAKARVQELSGELGDTQGQLAQRKQADSSAAAQSHIMQALTHAAKTGVLEGRIWGRLGDLGSIDAKYDIAVSSCTGMLDHIVVDSMTTAQACVNYIRQKGLGIATFVILKQQQERWAHKMAAITTPQGAPRLFDLVDTKDELRPAFYNALGNTVVARNMDHAAEIAYAPKSQLRKVVTLKGELISESGTMTGGGGKPRRGKMRLGSGAPAAAASDEGKDVIVLERDLQQLQKDLAEAQSEAAQAAKVVREASKKVAELETAARKVSMAAEAHQATAADLAQRLPALKAEAKVSKEDVKQLAALEAAIAVEDKGIAKLQRDMAGLNVEAEAVAAALEGVGGAELREQRALADTLQQDIAAAEEEVTRKGVTVAASRKSAAKLRRDVDKVAAELEALEQEEEAALERHEAAKAASFDHQEAVQAATEELLDCKKARDAAVAELDDLESKVRIIQKTWADHSERLQAQLASRNAEARKIKDNHAVMAKRRQKFEAEMEPDMASPFVDMGEEELDAVDVDALASRVLRLGNELDQAAPDQTAISKHKEAVVEHGTRLADLEKATAERDERRRAHEAMRKERLERFMAGFNTISLKLKEMYQMITLGGDAELELVDSLDPFSEVLAISPVIICLVPHLTIDHTYLLELGDSLDPFSEGIIFSVRPPKKSWKNIANLSGGEKTLSSLSLVFALHHFRPTPLYVMDEIDAALDFKNVSIVAHYIKERTRDAQFIIISLRNNMFELADRLVGIYKTDNTTKSVAINPADFVVGSAPPALPLAEPTAT